MLDPHRLRGLVSSRTCFRRLVKYEPGGEIGPSLAKRGKSASTAGPFATEGVTFSDGTPVDAAAVEWNFKRWAGKNDTEWLGVSRASRR